MEKLLLSEERFGKKFNHFENDDFIDRLNSRYTVMILTLCVGLVLGKIGVGGTINCWTPAQFSGTHNEYANSICWLKGSYYLPTEEITIPDRTKPRIYYVSYYQWTPFILFIMTIFFYLPRVLWHGLSRQGGMNLQSLLRTIKNKRENNEGIDFATEEIRSFIRRKKGRAVFCSGSPCEISSISITTIYFGIKLLYIINTIVQFILLNAFLSFQFTSHGLEAFGKLFTGVDWFESPRFPRVTMCDFMVRHLGSNQHWYSVQCNLPINIYNEKIFLGVWIWLMILTLLNIISLILWIVSLSSGRRIATIKKYLPHQQRRGSEKERFSRQKGYSEVDALLREKDNLNDFIGKLGTDGFLTLKLIIHNTDDVTSAAIIKKLYLAEKRDERNTDQSDV